MVGKSDLEQDLILTLQNSSRIVQKAFEGISLGRYIKHMRTVSVFSWGWGTWEWPVGTAWFHVTLTQAGVIWESGASTGEMSLPRWPVGHILDSPIHCEPFHSRDGVLGSIRKLGKQALGSKPLSSTPPWLLPRFLPWVLALTSPAMDVTWEL